jgi:oxygen-independent coproporphyrinogen-3 oxidase
MNEELIKKYNKSGPRYTSYPPLPFWNKSVDKKKWLEDVHRELLDNPSVDLYLHIPYCESLCYYCGCHRSITKNHKVELPFIEGILREWDIYLTSINTPFKIQSLHLGGGTPTFLSPENMEMLLKKILKNTGPSFEGSVEVDPRTCTIDHLRIFKEFGFNKISLGIQDFNHEVQKAINRFQSFEMVERIINQIRECGEFSINFDLIYGLPKQSDESIKETFEKVAKLAPDTIAFYSYAHLPEKIKNQKLISNKDIPSGLPKRNLYEIGRSILAQNNYTEIGMDHFAGTNSILMKAYKEKKLNRNFMGYTDKKTNILIGLGPSAISNTKNSFRQNYKNVFDYNQKLSEKEFPHHHGHDSSKTDIMTQEMILEILCLNKSSLKNIHYHPYKEVIIHDLKEYEKDGLIKFSQDELELTSTGKIFARNIAMVFDSYLREQDNKLFSTTI